jgi:hypothetical protein
MLILPYKRNGMKKWLLVSAGTILILLAASMLIPRIQEKTSSTLIKCPPAAVNRYIISFNKWSNWWPGNRITDTTWQIEQKTFRITQQLLNGFQALSEDETIALDLQFNPAENNETTLSIHIKYAFPFHPVYRLWAFLRKSKAEVISERLLTRCSEFFSQPANVYGIDIQKGKVKYFSWISTKETFDHYPTVEELYQTIETLFSYTNANNAKTLDDPIMHVYRENDNSYELMVAIPTDRDLPTQGRFQLKNMILGSLLMARVEGGPEKIRKAIEELENHVKDHRLVSPAIPFETLLTDRRKESDTARWVTLVNYPIFD